MNTLAIKETSQSVFKQSIVESEPIKPTHINEQNYWDNYYENETNYEWNNGILEENPVSDYATILIYNWLVKLFGYYFETHHNGNMANLEMGFRLNLGHKTCIRKPDLGIVCHHNPIQLQPKDRSYQGIFDICVEAVSDSSAKEIIRDTIVKKQEYAQAGIKEYYLVYEHGCDAVKGIELYRLEKGRYHAVKKTTDGLIQSSVLEGFQFRFSDCYHQPDAKKMCLDPVYQQFVFPEYQLEKKRADDAEQRADNVTQLFQQEKVRANDAEQQIIKLQTLLAKQDLNS
jgi:hypothetical protein